jgi:hypothetical protein
MFSSGTACAVSLAGKEGVHKDKLVAQNISRSDISDAKR